MGTAFLRTVILYILIMLGLRLMGKRQLGELEPAELVLTMMLSDLATVPMQDFGIPLLSGVIPILTLLALSLLASHLSLKSLRFRELACGTPAVLIDRGKILQSAMRRNRFTVDELLEELRAQGYTSPDGVKYAVLENSGQLSILPWAREEPPSAADLGMEPEQEPPLPVVLINDGRTLEKNLHLCGKDRAWLVRVVHERGFSSPKEIFLLTYAPPEHFFCLAKEETP